MKSSAVYISGNRSRHVVRFFPVGCTLNCSFCQHRHAAVGAQSHAGEIVGQIMVARDRLNDWADRETPSGGRLVTNVVMRGWANLV